MPAIVFSEIRSYADEYRIWSEDQRDRLIYLVQEMDDTYLAHVAEKMKPDTETKK